MHEQIKEQLLAIFTFKGLNYIYILTFEKST